MPEEYLALVTAMKSLTQESAVTFEPEKGLPVAEDEWDTRPDVDNYGIISLEFEADALRGDEKKHITAYEGSADLYSRKKDGDGWIPMIKDLLTEYCGTCWYLNYHTHELATGLYHWEWAFQIEE